MIKLGIAAGALVMAWGMAWPTGTGAGESETPTVAPLLFNLINQSGQPSDARNKAFTESVKRDAMAPQPSPMDDWEVQPDGSVKNKKTGMRVVLMNPCPAGDMEHEAALAAFNRAKSRR
ncbi:MAG TPA: hypothetical protein VEH80_08715 [Candidatus Bathyarchaeia archaeon]|nr:hypothetical protein [Candidatus Bathyarchaeia archaeon]